MRRLVIALLVCALPACDCGGEKATQTLAPIFEIHHFNEAASPQLGEAIADDAVVDFKGVKVDRAVRKSIALFNAGDLVLKVEEPTLEKGTDFTIARALAPCSGNSADPYAIEVGGCRLVTLQVKATQLGVYEDVLHLKSDDPKRSDVKLKIRATGTRGALQVCVSTLTSGSDADGPLDRCSTAELKELAVSFGSQPVGGTSVRRRVQLTNLSEVDLIVDGMKADAASAPDFAVDPQGFRVILAPGDVAEARAVFRPSTIGPRTGTITVTADDPATAPVLLKLSAQGDGPKLCVDPASLDFGTVSVGSASPPKSVTLRNCGTKPISISSMALEGNLDFQSVGALPGPRDLPEGEKIDLAFLFKPLGVGQKAARFKIASSDPASPLQFVDLKGKAVPPYVCKLEVSASVVDFGVVVSQTQARRTLTLHNAGNSPCAVSSVTIDAAGAAARFFVASSPPPPFAIAPNGLTQIEIGYQPLDPNPPDQGILTFKSDDPAAANGLLNVTLTGTPVATPECRLAITPAANGRPPLGGRQLNFGVVAIGDKKKLAATLKNVGSADCSIQYPAKGGLSFDSSFTFGTMAPTLPGKIKPGETASVEMVFQPTGAMQIPGFQQYITVQTDEKVASECMMGGTDGCKQFYLAGTGVVLAIDTVPATIDFGLVTIGCNSVDKVVTIYNVGGAAVTLKDFSIDPAGAPFTIVQKPVTPLSLNPGGSATVTVKYRPTTATPDVATLVIVHDFSSGQSTVPLKGTGTTEGHQIDTFTQNTEPKTDVLWVIDNSGSMSDKQKFLGQNARTFIQQANLTSNDYQVAVIAAEWSGTADTGFPHKADSASAYPGSSIYPGEFFGQPKVIKRTDPDPAGELEKNIKIGNCCSDSKESGLEGAKAALTNPLIGDPAKPNSSFVRPDAKLAIIALSDEEDQGASQSVQYYVDLFQQLKGAKNTQLFSFHAIAGDVPDGCSATVNGVSIAGAAGKRYSEAATRSNGKFRSICTTDWGTIAKDIGLDAFTARLQFILSRACDPATLKVKVNGTLKAAGVDFDYDAPSNSIVFKAAASPAPGATIVAEYDAACL